MLMEEEDIVECVSVIRAIMDKSSVDHKQQRCFEKIEELKEGDPAKSVPIAFKLLNEASDVSHVGWNIIEHIIRYKWNDMAPDIRLVIRNGVLQYMTEGRYSLTSENLPTKTFMSRNLVAIIEKEWPQNWPELFNQFKEIILNATLHSQAQMIFIVLKRLIENVITKENVSNILRRKELSTAINMMMPEIFAVTIDRLQMCIESGNSDNSILVAKSAIELLSESVDWVVGRVFKNTVDRLVKILCAYLQVASHGLNKSAATCLFKIASRKQSNPDEIPIIVSMFKDPPLQAIISAANLAAGVSASSADHYNHFKVLCNLLTALGIHLSEIWAYIKNPPPNFALYLSAIYSFFTHPSMCIRSDVSQVLVVFSNHVQISKTKEFIDVAKQVIPYIPNNIENIGSFDDTASVTSYFARFDCGDDVEFQRDVILLQDLTLRFMRETLTAAHIEKYLQQLNEWVNRIISQSDSIATNEWNGLKRYIMVFISVVYQKELVTNDVDEKFVTMFTSLMNKLETISNVKIANFMLSISSKFLQLFEKHTELITIYKERSKLIERISSLSLQADESFIDFSNEQSVPSTRISKSSELKINEDCFEFPRQSENNEPSTPEVMQYKSPQTLRNQGSEENLPVRSSGRRQNKPPVHYGEENFPGRRDKYCYEYNKNFYKARNAKTLKVNKNATESGSAKNQRAASAKNQRAASTKNQRAASTTDYREQETSSLSDFDDYEAPEPVTHPSDSTNNEPLAANGPRKVILPKSYFNVVGDIPSVDANKVESDLSSGESNYNSDTSLNDSSNSSCSEAEYPSDDDEEEEAASNLSPEDSMKLDSYTYKIYRDFGNYWAEIVALKQDRKNIYRKLVKQLNKDKKYSASESNEINVYIDLIEVLLNIYIPVAGRIKAKFVHGNQDVIMKRGFKYVRKTGTKYFKCPYIFSEILEFPCSSTIVLDDNDCLTPNSQFGHEHPKAISDSTNDDPIPCSKSLSFARVKSQLPPNVDYSKFIKWLKNLINDVVHWLLRAQRCYNSGKIFKELLAKMESLKVEQSDETFNDYEICISETKYFMERLFIKTSIPNSCDDLSEA